MSPKNSKFDLIVIGAGQAGSPLARDFSNAGKSVALIEREHLGGSCLNYGCTPSKDVIAAAKLAYDARRAGEFGLRIPEVHVEFGEVIRQARQLVHTQVSELGEELRKLPKLRLVNGNARLDGKDEGGLFRVQVGEETLVSDQVVLNTGARSFIPKIEGLDPKDVLCSENWLELDELPKKIVFLGSGYIGLEMGQFYRRMGTEVTLIEGRSQIMAHEDEDVAAAIQKFMEDEGIGFKLRSHLKKVEGKRGRYRLTLDSGTIEATHLFVATGRKAAIEGLGLESVGLKPLPNSYLEVDSKLSTRVKGLWVAGDLRGGLQFTHTSWDDYRILKSQLLADGLRTTDRIVPYGVFIDPELGRVGLSETEARRLAPKSGKEPTVAKFPFSDNLKAWELRETKGFIKLVADPETEELLGAAVLGPQAAELVHLYSGLMYSHAPYSVIRDQIMLHPTLGEAVQSATELLPKRQTSKRKIAS